MSDGEAQGALQRVYEASTPYDPRSTHSWLRSVQPGARQTFARLLEDGAADADVYRVDIDGRACPTVPAALEAIADALRFPHYYGHNSDAFIESLGDYLSIPAGGGLGSSFDDGRPGVPASALLILVSESSKFLPGSDGRDKMAFATFVDYALHYADESAQDTSTGSVDDPGANPNAPRATLAVVLLPARLDERASGSPG